MARAMSTVVLSTATVRLPLLSAKCSILIIMRLTWPVADRENEFFLCPRPPQSSAFSSSRLQERTIDGARGNGAALLVCGGSETEGSGAAQHGNRRSIRCSCARALFRSWPLAHSDRATPRLLPDAR